MNIHKEEEIAHYDKKARAWSTNTSPHQWDTDVHGVRHDLFSSYRFSEQWIKKNARGKTLLDYGCGTGIHSLAPAQHGAKVIGIDLSEESLNIARERVRRADLEPMVTFQTMDCEQMQFSSNSFDIVFDGGTFSSIDLAKALPDLARVLKKNGVLIGIETFGYNPFANLKRMLNTIRGIRTEWAAEHIVKQQDIDCMQKYFSQIEIYYFHLLSLFALPFIKLSFGATIFRVLDRLDAWLLTIPFLQRYAFKIVFICSEPKRAPSDDQTPL